MNRIDFNQVGGFPMTTNILAKLQTAFSLLNNLGNLAGNFTIISGCVVAGANTGDGVVVINNEVLEFRGGATQTKVIIKEDVENLTFQDGNSKPVIKTRYVTFGTGIGAINWVDFKRPIATKAIPIDLNDRLAVIEKKLAIFQTGGVVFPWFKPAAEIPEGFQEVADMRGRMIIGYDPLQTEFDAIGKKGGSKNHTLTTNEIPDFSIHLRGSNADNGDQGDLVVTSGSQENTGIDVVVNAEGGDAFSILNSYKIAMYIEFIG